MADKTINIYERDLKTLATPTTPTRQNHTHLPRKTNQNIPSRPRRRNCSPRTQKPGNPRNQQKDTTGIHRALTTCT